MTASLVGLLDVEPTDGSFRGVARDTGSMRTFGGVVLGQAVVAAGRTVDATRPVHSLHATFLRGADPTRPIDYTVDRVRDGRRFGVRQVSAHQGGRTLLTAIASFHDGEDGLEHEGAALTVPAPEDLPDPTVLFGRSDEQMQQWLNAYIGQHPVEVRFITELPPISARNGPAPSGVQVWVRSTEQLPDDPLLHAAAATYASDLFLLSSSLQPHALVFGAGTVVGSTLDHSVWFHRPFRTDSWLLFEQDSPWAGDGRALCRGHIRDRDGRIVATMVQEGLLRRPANPVPHAQEST